MKISAHHKETSAHAWSQVDTIFGELFVVSRGEAVIQISLTKEKLKLDDTIKKKSCPQSILRSLEDFSSGIPLINTPTLAPQGTSFQQLVWSALCDIPVGQTVTYGTIANRIGRPESARAVGQACGANPIPFLIPCHRVISSTGIGGFSLGLDLKIKLFKIESIMI